MIENESQYTANKKFGAVKVGPFSHTACTVNFFFLFFIDGIYNSYW